MGSILSMVTCSRVGMITCDIVGMVTSNIVVIVKCNIVDRVAGNSRKDSISSLSFESFASFPMWNFSTIVFAKQCINTCVHNLL